MKAFFCLVVVLSKKRKDNEIKTLSLPKKYKDNSRTLINSELDNEPLNTILENHIFANSVTGRPPYVFVVNYCC